MSFRDSLCAMLLDRKELPLQAHRLSSPTVFGLSERPLLPEGQHDLLVWDGFGPGLFGLIVASHALLSKTHHSSPPSQAERMLGSKAACGRNSARSSISLSKSPDLLA